MTILEGRGQQANTKQRIHVSHGLFPRVILFQSSNAYHMLLNKL